MDISNKCSFKNDAIQEECEPDSEAAQRCPRAFIPCGSRWASSLSPSYTLLNVVFHIKECKLSWGWGINLTKRLDQVLFMHLSILYVKIITYRKGINFGGNTFSRELIFANVKISYPNIALP